MFDNKRYFLAWLAIFATTSAQPVITGSAHAQAESQTSRGEPEGPFKELKYRSIGPAAGGRVCRVAGVPGNPLIYFAATASGGVWRSLDGGLSWKCVTEKLPTSTAGSIAVAPSDPNVIYMGSGEANIRNNVVPGNGIYKSTDAGSNWTQVWKQDGQIGDHGRPSAEPGHRLRGRARQGIRAQRRTGRLSDDRRRQDLGRRPQEGPGHRGLGRRP